MSACRQHQQAFLVTELVGGGAVALIGVELVHARAVQFAAERPELA
jgi:hypothetical protein